MSKGKQEMGQQVITRSLKVGDKFKIPSNPSQTYEVVNIKGDYLIYRNVSSHEEFQMVRGFASKVDLVEESADYQKKRFKEPYYMYNESAKTIKEAQERKKDYLAIVKRFRSDINKHIDKVERDIDRGFAIDYSDRDEAQVLGTRFSAELLRYNLAVENKTLTEGFMVKEKSGNTYIGRFDSKDKADKAVQDLAKKYGKSAANWLVEPDDKYMAAATAKGASSWGPIPMNTLTESFIIQDSDSNNKPVYFHYGKYTGYDWGFDKNAATKFSTKEAAERMLEKMRQEGMLINSMKVVSESVITESKYYIKRGKKYFCNMNGDPAWGPIKDFAIPFNSRQEAEKYMEKMSDKFPMFNYDYDIKVVNESKKVVEAKVSGKVVELRTLKPGDEFTFAIPGYNDDKDGPSWNTVTKYDKTHDLVYWMTPASRGTKYEHSSPATTLVIPKKYAVVNESVIKAYYRGNEYRLNKEGYVADKAGKKLAPWKTQAYNFGSEEDAAKAIKDIKKKPEWKDFTLVVEGRIAKGYENLNPEERAKHLLSHPTSKYMSDLKSENITERAIRKAVKEMFGKPDKDDPQFITDVNEEGEAVAPATSTANVANPELPLKLKEDLESDKAEALEEYKKAKAEYLANKSDENWKKFSDAKAKCMQLGCRI